MSLTIPAATNVSKQKGARLDFIDSLRGLAALYVLFFHTALVPQQKLLLPKWLEPFIMNGGSGVTLFFLISAFTLCYTLNFQQHEDRYLIKFYIRRAFRILPLYYFVFILLRAWQSGLHGIWADKFNIMLYTLFGFNFVPFKQTGYVWASWTLGVEVVFYMIFPLIFRFVKSIRSAMIFVVISLILAWVHQLFITYCVNKGILAPGSYIIYYSLLNQVPVFAMGMLCFFIYNNALLGKKIAPIYGVCLLIGGTALFFMFAYGVIKAPDFLHLYIKGIIYSIIFFGLLISPVKVIVNKLTAFYGAISYSLYLDHPVIVFKLNNVYKKIYTLSDSVTLNYFLCITLTLIIVTGLAYSTYRFIETPMIAYGRKLIKNMRPASSAVLADQR
jgi:peptidoglycan/LPS O-acetylase OafA/YrhL